MSDEPKGWIKLHRKFNNWEWRDSPETVSLFIQLLLEANPEPRSWRGTVIPKGGVVFGRRQWAKRLGISERQIRTCVERLKSTHEVTTESTNQFTIITLVNYEQYQSKPESPTHRAANKTPTSDQQATTPKEESTYVDSKELITRTRPSVGFPDSNNAQPSDITLDEILALLPPDAGYARDALQASMDAWLNDRAVSMKRVADWVIDAKIWVGRAYQKAKDEGKIRDPKHYHADGRPRYNPYRDY
jgi:hypothetical protein